GGCGAAAAAPRGLSRCHGPGPAPPTRATSKTSSPSWRSSWPRRRSPKTPIARLLGVAWDTVGRIVERVVTDHLDERRRCGLVEIGVETVCA
ncbi:MAG TPA: hypothetical protein VJ598_14380, partial [Albitalea sp.]|nr:hypothetical protein [Albitalea sp.]